MPTYRKDHTSERTNTQYYPFLFIGILVFSILPCSCNNVKESKDETNFNVISVDEKNYDRRKDFSQIFKNIDLIPLETSEESLIGRIKTIKEYKNHYYILDNEISKSLMIFDNRGRFVNRISSIGKGPQEYIDLSFFAVDKYSDQLIVCSRTPYKLLKYSLLGDFIDEVALERPPDAVEALDESSYIIKYSGREDNICVTDKQGNLIESLYSNSNPERKAILFKDLILYSDKVLYHQNYNDTIYYLSEKGMKPWLYIDFKERRITQDIVEKIYSETMRLKHGVAPPNNVLTGSYFYTESDDNIYFAFDAYDKGRRSFNYHFYSKITGESVIFPSVSESVDNLNKKYGFLNFSLIMDANLKGQFIGHVNSIHLIESLESINDLVEEEFITVNGIKGMQGVKILDENSNPTIVLYTFHDTF